LSIKLGSEIKQTTARYQQGYNTAKSSRTTLTNHDYVALHVSIEREDSHDWLECREMVYVGRMTVKGESYFLESLSSLRSGNAWCFRFECENHDILLCRSGQDLPGQPCLQAEQSMKAVS
jgi:hypothetical protein